MITRVRELWNTLFWPRRRLSSGDKPDGGLFGRRERVLPRSRLLHRRFQLVDIPASRRSAVLELKLAAWRPFSDARYWCGWEDGSAHVWAWSAADPGLELLKGEHPVPETALQQAPAADGPRLVHCLVGFEGQIWQAGELRHSRWWAEYPSLSAWNTFIRAAGQHPGSLPQPERLVLGSRPWARSTAASLEWLARNETNLVTATGALMLFLLGWQAAALWKSNQELEIWERQHEGIRSSASAQLAARESAISHQSESARLLAQTSSPTALTLMHQVLQVIPADAVLTEWQLGQRQLEFIVESDQTPDAEGMVRAIQEIPFLSDVLVERVRAASGLRVQALIRAMDQQ